MKILFIITTTFLILSCNSGKREESGDKDKTENASANDAKSTSKWSNEDQVNFMDDCIMEAAKKMKEDSARVYCACMLTKAQSAYPEFEDVSKKMTVDQVDEWALECMGK